MPKPITSPPRTLIIAAHPDDELLGAGGWMARYPGCEVAIVSDGTLTEHEVTEGGRSWLEYLSAKEGALQEAAKLIGFSVIRIGDFPDQQIPFNRGLQMWVESVMTEVRPEVVITHSFKETNRDHRVVAEAVHVAARPYARTGSSLNMLLAFHVDPLGIFQDFQPQLYVPLSEDELSRKLQALALYEKIGAIRDWPHPRSIKAVEIQARYCGSKLGCPAAEAYELIWGQL